MLVMAVTLIPTSAAVAIDAQDPDGLLIDASIARRD
jgi:hypothetical protein